MSKMIKYAVKCNSLYKLIAVISVCALLGTSLYFVCDTIQHITDKICEYKEISIKAQYDDTSLEVDLHERNDLGTEQSSSYFIILFLFHLIYLQELRGQTNLHEI